MPQLHSQYAGAAKLPNGQVMLIPGPQGLIKMGPRIQVRISLGNQFAQELAKRGEPIPNPVVGHGLIDTGAGCSCIDEEVAKQLFLPVIDVVKMTSASHASTDANAYPMKLELLGGQKPIEINVSKALGASLKGQKLIALIGRDVLAHCTLVYNGQLGSITLCL